MIETVLKLSAQKKSLEAERYNEEARRTRAVRKQLEAEYSGKIREVRRAASMARDARLGYVFDRFEEDRTQSFIALVDNRWNVCRWARMRSEKDWNEYKYRKSQIYVAVHAKHPWPHQANPTKPEVVVRKGWRWKPGSPHSLQVSTDTVVFLDEIRSLDRNRQARTLKVGRHGDKAWITPALGEDQYWIENWPAVRADGPAVLTNSERRWDQRPNSSASAQFQTWIKPNEWLGPARLRPEGLPGIIPPLNV